MTDPAQLETRIEQLETTVAFQENAIDDLTEALAEHYRQIEALKRDLAKLSAQLAQVEAHPALAPDQEPPPPHY